MNKLLDQFLQKAVGQLVKEFSKTDVMSTQQAKSAFQFLTQIACGNIPTTATFIRNLIQTNKHYKQDSKLSEELLDSLTEQLLDIQTGKSKMMNSFVDHYTH